MKPANRIYNYIQMWNLRLMIRPDLFREEFQGQRIIDIGCGSEVLNAPQDEIRPYVFMEHFFRSGGEKYTGVDDNNGIIIDLKETLQSKAKLNDFPYISRNKKNISFVTSDGLEFLAEQPNKSAIIMANSVFVKEFELMKSMPQNQEYIFKCLKEIARIVPKQRIFFGCTFGYGRELKQLGFQDCLIEGIYRKTG